MVITGGLSDTKKPDEHIEKIVNTIKSEIEERINKTLNILTVHSYKTQVVAGTNYFIKSHIGNNEYIHIRVFKSLPHENYDVKLVAIELNRKETDPIEYFV